MSSSDSKGKDAHRVAVDEDTVAVSPALTVDGYDLYTAVRTAGEVQLV
jgi:hypothetical protein